ncbi:MAG TPA: Cu(I)-responsive transcriptional regulator [Beijerinckiaceae bacterium]|nr:Cu(I)-responsive transcriptional regulator [Rhodoblastus sp.]MCC0000743.1 Cu(I)-responsive transcriptional regulator [Methylobacteriaceae bacterium]HRY02486.1 Cu(I)-responsive transcriptional regulator [Beijerinckiaceae bacterium]MCB1524618.1 Cu(I)-responsive transcriptional regulator [Rhodoblastus sp.]MCC0002926.1 Cu(I)-responsive transcriptional regulator [Methylobacteriaceae bacterium]
MNVSIGEAAKVSGVSAKMIRYYESIGLIAAPRRSAAGYRFYDERDVQTLRFVRRARDLGFQVEDIGKLLELWRDGARSSADVKRLAEHHIAELEGKIAALQAMQRTLEQLACACHGDERPDCPILEDLSAGSDGAAAKGRGFAS